ncbi:MAG TPA: protocatechuate 3,4-dioxygenase subunit alpha [Acetobacteraceae bacterium]|nr:protocatechuate 3,4-dioxygenase subunit alpha [Acetobacteraceae bacterium]
MPLTTASQTIGPFWHLLEDPNWADLTRFGAEGDRIVLTGVLTDGDGSPFPEACIEIWQSDPPASDRFPGFGRCATDRDGRFRFTTLKPGPVPGRGNTQQAPHIAVSVLARGLMRGLVTRAYFQSEALNAADPLLNSIEDPVRRATLIARPDGAGTWRLNICLQGTSETVFLDV